MPREGGTFNLELPKPPAGPTSIVRTGLKDGREECGDDREDFLARARVSGGSLLLEVLLYFAVGTCVMLDALEGSA